MMIPKNFFLLAVLFLSISTALFAPMKSASSVTNVDKILKEDQYVVLKFSATWCGPCHAMAPEIHRLASKLTNVTFVDIDIDQFPALASRYGVRSIPTLLYFENGRNIGTDVGLDRSRVEGRLKQVFKLQ